VISCTSHAGSQARVELRIDSARNDDFLRYDHSWRVDLTSGDYVVGFRTGNDCLRCGSRRGRQRRRDRRTVTSWDNVSIRRFWHCHENGVGGFCPPKKGVAPRLGRDAMERAGGAISISGSGPLRHFGDAADVRTIFSFPKTATVRPRTRLRWHAPLLQQRRFSHWANAKPGDIVRLLAFCGSRRHCVRDRLIRTRAIDRGVPCPA